MKKLILALAVLAASTSAMATDTPKRPPPQCPMDADYNMPCEPEMTVFVDPTEPFEQSSQTDPTEPVAL